LFDLDISQKKKRRIPKQHRSKITPLERADMATVMAGDFDLEKLEKEQPDQNQSETGKKKSENKMM